MRELISIAAATATGTGIIAAATFTWRMLTRARRRRDRDVERWLGVGRYRARTETGELLPLGVDTAEMTAAALEARRLLMTRAAVGGADETTEVIHA